MMVVVVVEVVKVMGVGWLINGDGQQVHLRLLGKLQRGKTHSKGFLTRQEGAGRPLRSAALRETQRSVMHGEETPRRRKTKPEVKQRVTTVKCPKCSLFKKVPYGKRFAFHCWC